jgi:pimeloyl-ACP methyl ester carboxylesterase
MVVLLLSTAGCRNEKSREGQASEKASPKIADTLQTGSEKSGIAALQDARIEYVIQGEGSPIVLLPGGGLSTEYLKPLAGELARAGYQVIRINPRGAGQSQGPAEGATMHTMAGDVIGVLKALGLEKVDLAGHAFGNRVARTVEHDAPEYVRSVICLAAGGVVKPKAEAAEALSLVFNPEASEEEILKSMRYMVGDPANATASWALVKPSRFPAAAAVVGSASQTPESSWATPSGKNPFLVIQGTNDQVAPPENGELLKKELGDLVELVSIEGAGHLMVINHAGETTEAILRFLQTTFN